jgi:hypothetical protein
MGKVQEPSNSESLSCFSLMQSGRYNLFYRVWYALSLSCLRKDRKRHSICRSNGVSLRPSWDSRWVSRAHKLGGSSCMTFMFWKCLLGRGAHCHLPMQIFVYEHWSHSLKLCLEADLTDWRFGRAIMLKDIMDRTCSAQWLLVWWRHFYVRDNFWDLGGDGKIILWHVNPLLDDATESLGTGQ